jgi:exopolysaccharide biosynthesis polyprenyl glycosylphosphotransferase
MTGDIPNEAELRADEAVNTSPAALSARLSRLGWSRGTSTARQAQTAESTARGVIQERRWLVLWDLLTVVVIVPSLGVMGRTMVSLLGSLAVGTVAVVVIGQGGVYRRTSWLHEHPVRAARRLLAASTAAIWATVLLSVAYDYNLNVVSLVATWLAMPVVWFTGRRIAALVRKAHPERVLIIGNGVVAQRVMELSNRPCSPIVVVGCLEDPENVRGVGDVPYLGPIDRLSDLLSAGEADRVVVAFSRQRDEDILRVLRESVGSHCPVDIVPRFFDFVGPAAPQFYHTEGLAFLSVPAQRLSRGQMALKRAVDICVSAILLVLTAPVFLFVALAIVRDSGRPIFFRQPRAGLRGSTFTMLKFRTLRPVPVNVTATSAGVFPVALEDLAREDLASYYKEEGRRRVTRVGVFQRKTSLDELPQLINVLRGEMSLIGPRPLLLIEFDLLQGWELARQEMRPGLTGLWQVSGRSETSWDQRMGLDHSQVHHWSLWSDLEILADTLPAVMSQRGAG